MLDLYYWMCPRQSRQQQQMHHFYNENIMREFKSSSELDIILGVSYSIYVWGGSEYYND